MAFQVPITVKEAISKIHSKTYLLPAIQREVVWDTAQIERLFDSLMRDYPIGTFLFWMVKRKQTGKYQFYDVRTAIITNAITATTLRLTSPARRTLPVSSMGSNV